MLLDLYAFTICGKKLDVVKTAATTPMAEISVSAPKTYCGICCTANEIIWLSVSFLIKRGDRINAYVRQIILQAGPIPADTMTKLKDLVEGTVVGSGSDYIVVQKGKKRLLLQGTNFQIKELKNAVTPYGSQID